MKIDYKGIKSLIYIYIYIQIYQMNAIVRLPHPRSGDSQGQETFLAPSADKQTRNYDVCMYIYLYIYASYSNHFRHIYI